MMTLRGLSDAVFCRGDSSDCTVKRRSGVMSNTERGGTSDILMQPKPSSDTQGLKYVQIIVSTKAWVDSVVFKKHRELTSKGAESYVFWGRGSHEQDEHMQRINTKFEIYMDALETRLDGRAGFHSKAATKRLLSKLDNIQPDVVHLHVLTGYYVNIEMLFDWLSHHDCKVIITLHDCWDFTGHCIYFTYARCNQWKTGCAFSATCPQKREYPEAWFTGDGTIRRNWEDKRRIFTSLPPERVQLITPSEWLARIVRQSFLGKYDVKVVPNTVNTDVFKPTPSDFRERHGLGNRFVVLGVASKWSERKGLQDFVQLARDLSEQSFAVVVIGLSEKQIKQIKEEASRIVALPKTDTQLDLVQAYTAANILFNPTREDNYPTVNLEAEACGTPVVTYDTGGCGETLHSTDSHVVSGYTEGLGIIKRLQSTSTRSVNRQH